MVLVASIRQSPLGRYWRIPEYLPDTRLSDQDAPGVAGSAAQPVPQSWTTQETLTDMPPVPGDEGLRRTLTVPPVTDSPRSARRFVVAALRGRVDPDLVDTVLLLVTELVTNVVVHAGTDATVDLRHDATGLAISVSDRNPTTLGAAPSADDPDRLTASDQACDSRAGASRVRTIEGLRENGRGLAMVDALATAWGTEHDRTGKKVWFRLDAPVPDQAPREDHDGTPVEPPQRMAVDILRPARLLAPGLATALSTEDEVRELLAQLVDALPTSAAGLVRRPGRAKSAAAEVVATCGPTGAERDARRIPLESRDGIVGELLLWSPLPPLGPGPGPWNGNAAGALEGQRARDDRQIARPEAEVPGALEERIAVVTRWMALTLGGANLRRAEERRIGMLSFLAEASDLLAGSLDTERSLALLARLPVPRLARWCAVYLLREDGAVKLAAVGHVDEAEAADLSAWAGDPVGPLAPQVQAALADTVRVATINGSPTVIATMRARRRVLGVVALGRAVGNSFQADEIELLADLARRAAFAVDNARLFRQQVEVASALQAGLLPPELPNIDGIELGSSYRAARAGLEVGGDFFDLVPNPDGGWTIIIGDVCGKGAEAANVTGVVRAVLRLLAGQRNNLPDIMMDLNRALRDAGHPNSAGQGRFCTLAVAELRPPDVLVSAGSDPAAVTQRTISICMAGHPLPIVVRANGTAMFVAEPGTLLGVLDDHDVAFPEVQVALAAGDALILYTDGVVEARRGRELFGDERLLTAVRGCAGMSAQGIADRVRASADRFAGGRLRDDVAVVVARIPK